MAKYRLTHPVWVAANGNPNTQYFKAGEVIDFDGVPSSAMLPLDAEAIAAKARVGAPQRMKNGLQIVGGGY
jgi:hypothetical protein